jgi:hypothetical protein
MGSKAINPTHEVEADVCRGLRVAMERLVRRMRAGLVICFAVTMAACGGNSDEPKLEASEVPNEVARGTVTVPEGGSIVVPASAAGLVGAKIEFPPHAAREDLAVQVGFEDALPAPMRAEALDSDTIPVSRTIVLKAAGGGSSEFNRLVTVTMPYDAVAARGLPPAVLFWDAARARYRPAAVVAVDRDKGTVSFRTSHFSRYVAAVVRKLGAGVPDVDTGFRVGKDSVLHSNFSTYAYGGLCAAFASLPTYYFSLGRPTGLFSFAQQGTPDQPNDDELTRSAMNIVYAIIAENWGDAIVANRLNIGSAADMGLLIWQSMLITGEPVHMVMSDQFGLEAIGHSVVVYAYDAESGQFKIYDSNFPTEEVSFGWNLLTGFGLYSKGLAYLPNLFTHLGYATDNTFGAPDRFHALLADWESGQLQSQFANLEITDATGTPRPLLYGSKVVTSLPEADASFVRGRFIHPAGSTGPFYLHVFHDGVKLGTEGSLIDDSGQFELQFPEPLQQKVEVMLAVSKSPRSMTSRFAAFGLFTAEPSNRGFLTNLGFETGDLSGWQAVSRLLNTGADFAPPKAEVVFSGTDPIATDLSTTASGNWALRINDHGPGYHATTVTQRAVVPAAGRPQIRFRWAAVLEDPRHTPEDQPYVEVSVRNVSRGVDLYRQRFYTDDPLFSGWTSYRNGQWKAIPWQTVVVSGLSQYSGDEVELRIEGADCGRGAHGGTVYLDAAD